MITPYYDPESCARAAKNELVRHMLACLVYRITKIIHDAPANYPDTSIGNSVRTPEKILGHINSLIQLSNRFWSHDKPVSMAVRRNESSLKGWDLEVDLFYKMVAEFDETLKANISPRKHSPEKILQRPLLDAFTHVGQLACSGVWLVHLYLGRAIGWRM